MEMKNDALICLSMYRKIQKDMYQALFIVIPLVGLRKVGEFYILYWITYKIMCLSAYLKYWTLSMYIHVSRMRHNEISFSVGIMPVDLCFLSRRIKSLPKTLENLLPKGFC